MSTALVALTVLLGACGNGDTYDALQEDVGTASGEVRQASAANTSRDIVGGDGPGSIYDTMRNSGAGNTQATQTASTPDAADQQSLSAAPSPAPAPTPSPAPAPTAAPTPSPAPSPAPTPAASPAPAATVADSSGSSSDSSDSSSANAAQPDNSQSADNSAPAPNPAPAPAPAPVAASDLSLYPAQQIVTGPLDDPMIPRPAYLSPSYYAPTGTSIVRVTDEGTFGGGRSHYKQAYAKRSVWNADQSYILLAGQYPAYLLDGRTYQLIKTVNQPGDPIWSDVDPEIIFGVVGNSFVAQNVVSGQRTEVYKFSNYSKVLLGGGSGNQSYGDGRVALVGQRSGGVDVIVLDIQNRSIVTTKRFDGVNGPYEELDEASISPSGNYVVIGWDAPNEKAYVAYDANTMNRLHRLTNRISHADLGWDQDNEEVIVTQDTGTDVHSIRLRDGNRRLELDGSHLSWNQHTSCRNVDRRGWCYIGTNYHPDLTGNLLYSEIFAIKLDGSGTIERYSPGFFSMNPADDRYYRASMAVPSRDGQRVLFASDWNDSSASAVVHSYVVGVNP